MSDNQSRGGDKNEYKRSDRSRNPNSPRNFPGGGGGRGGGSSSSTTTTPPSGTNIPGRGVNHGVLRTPRGQPPGQYIGGILYEQMQTPSQLGVHMLHNNLDSDRWQPATNFHKELIPSPQTPGMHKAERKYEIGKITDEEQAKQRILKGILNKMNPQNFEKLFDQVKQVNIDNAGTLSGVVGQIFEKALMKPTFVEMYANFCSRFSVDLPDFSEGDVKITFKRLLLDKCQEEFERGEREEEEANRTEEGGEVKKTEEEREEARRRKLGNIRLIGELYKKGMLTERIMHECIRKLLDINQTADPNEENIEALCNLMSTIGEMIDHPKVKEEMDVYFDMMFKLSNNMDFSSRVRFMLKDAIDLRKNKWQQRTKVESPKKINKVHKEAAQQRQAQANRLASGPSSNPTTRRAQMDFGPKGSNVLPSTPQMGVYHGLPQQIRACGNTDPRLDTFENRPLSVPLSAMGDDTITLGSQGGLARGMSVRGQPSMQGMSLHDMDSRRGVAGPSGYGSISERAGYGLEDLAGRGFGQVPPSSPPELARVTTPPQSGPLDKVMSEERLHDKSIETIKEFYRSQMTFLEVKNSMQLDILDDSRCQNDLWEVIKKLQAKKDGYKAKIQEIRASGRNNTNLEQLYVTYVQEKIDMVDKAIGMIYDAHFALGEALSHAEMWQQNIGEDKTVDSVKCSPTKIKHSK